MPQPVTVGIVRFGRKRSRLLMGIVSSILIAISLFLGWSWYLTEQRYQAGKLALEHGDWETAQKEFQSIGSYRDTTTLLKESYYLPAIAAIIAHDWDRAALQIMHLESIELQTNYRDVANHIRQQPALATAIARQRAAAWQRGFLRTVFTIHADSSLNSLAFSPDGHQLAVAMGSPRTGTLGFWQLTPAVHYRQLVGGTAGSPFSRVQFSADGHWLAASRGADPPDQQTTMIWNVPKHNLYGSIAAGAGIFSTQDNTLAAIARDGKVGLWQIPEGALLTTFVGTTTRVRVVAFSPNGQFIAAGQPDGTISIWRSGEQQPMHILPPPDTAELRPDSPLIFSPDSTLLATSREYNVTTIWRVADGQVLFSLRSQEPVNAIAVSPNNTIVALGTIDIDPRTHQAVGYLTLWHLPRQQQIQRLAFPADPVRSVLWNPDGTTLVVGRYYGAIDFLRPVPPP